MENENENNQNEEEMSQEPLAAIDAVIEELENGDTINNNEAVETEEASYVELRNIVIRQGELIEQLIDRFGKLITLYGIRISDNGNEKNEYMKSLKVEKTFTDSDILPTIPELKDISLS